MYRNCRSMLLEPRWTRGNWDILGIYRSAVTVKLKLTLVALLFCRDLW
jgi:hypothetical protein